MLRQRARLLAIIRSFFAERGVLEVETPLLCSAGVTDPSIEPLVVERGHSLRQPRYLQSSPEYTMKRLLAAHGEAIYQICKAFRDGEAGPRHNPEFTLLEWYRPGFDPHELMDEVADLVRRCLGDRPVHKFRYRELFFEKLSLDPMLASVEELEGAARARVNVSGMAGDRDMWLDVLMSHVIEPQLADQGMCFVYNYPASQAALARIVRDNDVEVGQRFELYVDGVELANGYCELVDAFEQRQRFEADNVRRAERGVPSRPLDERLLAALEYGLPPCSGVALGVDRLLLLVSGESDLRRVVPMDWENC